MEGITYYTMADEDIESTRKIISYINLSEKVKAQDGTITELNEELAALETRVAI